MPFYIAMLGSPIELALVVGALSVMVAPLLCFGSIFRKAGYNSWLALLMVIPGVNFVMFLWFAFSTWPSERESAIPENGSAG
ncbi:MAG TPA: hypothetical protein VGG22_15120 [Candidatus Baltobacteraceae bacterium]|jgi:hypothetical protein